MAKLKFYLSVLKTTDKKYFRELFNSLTDMTGLEIPGKCKFCEQEAWHIIEETFDDNSGKIKSIKTNHFLCCDEGSCLAKALPELFEKIKKHILKKVE